jgi:hypothetical protein
LKSVVNPGSSFAGATTLNPETPSPDGCATTGIAAGSRVDRAGDKQLACSLKSYATPLKPLRNPSRLFHTLQSVRGQLGTQNVVA